MPSASSARALAPLAPPAPPERRLVAVPPPTVPTPEEVPGPDPRYVAALAVHAYECLDGSRPIAQLGSAISFELAQQLSEIRAARMERRSLVRDRRRIIPVPGRPVICRPVPHAVEATVALHAPHRSYAVAIRLEWVHGRWRASELVVL